MAKLQQARERKWGWRDNNIFVLVWKALLRKPNAMATQNYKPNQLRISHNKDGVHASQVKNPESQA